jgi:hypothetical protein
MPAAAAAALVAATATITYTVARHSTGTPAQTVASNAAQPEQLAQPTPRVQPETVYVPVVAGASGASVKNASATREVEAVARQTERLYGREIDELENVIRVRRNDLDPHTLAIIESNVKLIETAIAQTRAALAKDPASGFLLEKLNSALDTKVELLRTAAQLPARS